MGRMRSRAVTGLRIAAAGILPGLAMLPAYACAPCPAVAPFERPIADAAVRFALPEALLRAVIAVESNDAVFAVSPKGAMGLMQVMPGTWADLRSRHGLGADPFDPCDNILAGAAYLREMLDRYGDPGFLAAYNAGPGRYEAWRAGRRPLPSETIAYIARINRRLGDAAGPVLARSPVDPDAWRRGNLFVIGSVSEGESAPKSTSIGSQASASEAGETPRETLFVVRSGGPK